MLTTRQIIPHEILPQEKSDHRIDLTTEDILQQDRSYHSRDHTTRDISPQE